MAVHAPITPPSETQARKIVNDDRRKPETFRINGCTPLIAESHDYYRQAHALACIISGAFSASDGNNPNDEITAGAIEAIEQLLAHGIYQQEQEERRSR